MTKRSRAASPCVVADGLEIADLDDDGYLDLVSVHEDGNHIRLAFGTGDVGVWDLRTLAEGSEIEGPEDIALGDVNGDGSLDILVACEGGTLAYFQNPGKDYRDPSQWHRTLPTVSRGKGSWVRVYLADLDQDGRLEAIAPNKTVLMHAGEGSMDVPASAVSWFEIPADPLDADAWIEHELGRYRVPVNSEPIDLDGDGDLDILAGSRGEGRMVIFENVGLDPLEFREVRLNVRNRSIPKWPPLPKRLSGMVMDYADLNSDGRLDIVTFETPWSVVWLEQPEAFEDDWQIHPIATAFPDSPTALSLVDINGNQRLDLFSGGYSEDPREEEAPDPNLFHRAAGLFWFEQTENPEAHWIRHDISRRVRGMFDVLVPLDMNGDDITDFVGTRGNSGSYDGVFWIEQRRTATPQPTFTQARESESRQLPPTPRLAAYPCQQYLDVARERSRSHDEGGELQYLHVKSRPPKTPGPLLVRVSTELSSSSVVFNCR